jgi:hypothetical protein
MKPFTKSMAISGILEIPVTSKGGLSIPFILHFY